MSRTRRLLFTAFVSLGAAVGCSDEAEDDTAADSGASTDAQVGAAVRDAGVSGADAGPVDTGVQADAGPVDTGVVVDSGAVDTGVVVDAGPVDSGIAADSGPADSGAADSGVVDAGAVASGTTQFLMDLGGYNYNDAVSDTEMYFVIPVPDGMRFAYRFIGAAEDMAICANMTTRIISVSQAEADAAGTDASLWADLPSYSAGAGRMTCNVPGQAVNSTGGDIYNVVHLESPAIGTQFEIAGFVRQ